MRKQVAAVVLAGLTLLPAAAQAKMTPLGSSGIINAPSGYVRLPGHVSAGYDMTKDDRAVKANVSLPLGIEVSGAKINPKNGETYSVVNAKWQLIREMPFVPAIAIGGEDLGKEKHRVGYIAASKAFPAGFKLHAGVGTGNQYKHGFYAAEKELSLLGIGMNLKGEYDGSHFNYGAELPVGKFLEAEVGYRNKHLYGGMNLTF